MDYFDPLGRAFWATVGFAVLCRGIVGCERQLRGRPAGIRTSIRVCLSTAVFIHLGTSNVGEAGGPTRVLGQLVTGVGFLGAGLGHVLGAVALAIAPSASSSESSCSNLAFAGWLVGVHESDDGAS